MLAAILVVGGLGGAAFHPPAAALAHRLGGERPGFAMSVYITGGTLGFSLGPLMFAPFASASASSGRRCSRFPGWSSSRSSSPRAEVRVRRRMTGRGFGRCVPTPGRSALLY